MPSESLPYLKRLRWYYRGPDVPGTHLSIAPEDAAEWFRLEYFCSLAPSDWTEEVVTLPTTTVKVAQYDPAGIRTTADLAALSPVDPPARIETLAEFTVPGQVVTLASPGAWLRVVPLAVTAVPLNRFAGPQLVGIEITAPWALESAAPGMRFFAHLVHAQRVLDGLRLLQVRAL